MHLLPLKRLIINSYSIITYQGGDMVYKPYSYSKVKGWLCELMWVSIQMNWARTYFYGTCRPLSLSLIYIWTYSQKFEVIEGFHIFPMLPKNNSSFMGCPREKDGGVHKNYPHVTTFWREKFAIFHLQTPKHQLCYYLEQSW